MAPEASKLFQIMATGSEHPDASPATEDGEEDSEDEMMVVEIDATGTVWWYTVGNWFSDKGEVWIEAPPQEEKKKGRKRAYACNSQS